MKDALIMLPVEPILVTAFTSGMDHDEVAVVKDPDHVTFPLNFNRFSHKTKRNGIPIGFKGNHAVSRDMTNGPFLNRIGMFSLV